MKRKNILSVMIVVCAAFMFLAASYSEAAVIGITSGRARALMVAAVGLSSLVVGGMALSRSAGRFGTGSGRTNAIVALVLGLVCMVLSVAHIANSSGFGTGGGRAGAIVALLLALIGMTLGALALARSRRSSNNE